MPRPRTAARDVLATCFYDPGRISPELVEEAARYGNASFPEFVRALSAGVGLRGVRASIREAWLGRAAAYGGPVLITWGREDRVLPVHHLADSARAFPQAEIRIVEHCGHLLMAERPDELDRKSTRLNSSHVAISYAVFCLKKKTSLISG